MLQSGSREEVRAVRVSRPTLPQLSDFFRIWGKGIPGGFLYGNVLFRHTEHSGEPKRTHTPKSFRRLSLWKKRPGGFRRQLGLVLDPQGLGVGFGCGV